MFSRKLLAENSIVDFDSSFLNKEESDCLLDFLIKKVQWEQLTYQFGKKKTFQPRLTAWFADRSNMIYSYSGVTQKVQAWFPELFALKEKIELTTNSKYNSVLLNYYRDGTDSIGFHADDEKELGINATIASLSLGATRTFLLKQYRSSSSLEPEGFEEYWLSSGSLLVMSGGTQHYWKHGIPKQQWITEPRVNLTFRNFIL